MLNVKAMSMSHLSSRDGPTVEQRQNSVKMLQYLDTVLHAYEVIFVKIEARIESH